MLEAEEQTLERKLAVDEAEEESEEESVSEEEDVEQEEKIVESKVLLDENQPLRFL